MKTLAQGAINKSLISLPKVLFQYELIDVFKNALVMVMEKSLKRLWKVVKFSFENCVGTLNNELL